MFQRNLIGIIGILIALAGVGVAIFQDQLRPPPPPAGVQLKDAAVEKSAEIFGIGMQKRSELDWVTATHYGLGFVAIVLGVFSWVRKENHRIAVLAAGLGVVAAAWEYVLYGVAIAVVLLVLGALS